MEKGDAEHIKAIVKGCLKNKSKCQEMLYKMHYGKMLAVCVRYASDRDEAKDMLQEGFIKVFKNLNKYDINGSLGGWIRRIIVNNCIDMYRKKKNNMLSLDTAINIDRFEGERENNDESSNYNNISAKMIIEVLQKLTPSYKLVFNLYVMEDYTHKEIAEMLSISEGTSKSNLSRAKDQIKRLLKKEKTL